MNIRVAGVVGLGPMGAGIAEVFARAGLNVTAVEADPRAAASVLEVLSAMYSGYGDPAFAPQPMLRDYALGGPPVVKGEAT
jgi:NADPH-dependent 2,4-dienoyl-CoA reductase/sulfur reductase-like enzyme